MGEEKSELVASTIYQSHQHCQTSQMEHTPRTIICESELTLKYDGDKYDGVIVNEQSLPGTKADFAQALKQSMRVWKANSRRGVWLRIPVSKIDFTSVAIDFGFVMHHAERDYLMLTHWLSDDENMLPSNASHQVGVGCVVMNNEGIIVFMSPPNQKNWR